MRAAALVLLLFAAGDVPAPYRVARAGSPHDVLLAAEDAAWAKAERIAWGPSEYETTFRALWDDQGLLVRFDARDPSPWHTMTKRDEHLWEEEVVEVFLDLDRSGRDYYELEISPANVVCDVRMIVASPWKGELEWDLPGLLTNARLTPGAGKAGGWTATAFMPWSGFSALPSAKTIALPPKPGDAWRFNAFRIERPGGKAAPEQGAVEVAYSPPPGESFHAPEAFKDFIFEAAR